MIGAGAAAVVSLWTLSKSLTRHEYVHCDLDEPFGKCTARQNAADAKYERDEAAAGKYRIASAVLLLGGGVAAGIGMRLLIRPHAISEEQAHALGEAHNAKLRLRYDVSRSRPRRDDRRRVRELAWAPNVYADGAGLAIAGRF